MELRVANSNNLTSREEQGMGVHCGDAEERDNVAMSKRSPHESLLVERLDMVVEPRKQPVRTDDSHLLHFRPATLVHS